jgi:hypothetical protein
MLYRNGKLPSSPLQAMFEDFVLTPSAYLQKKNYTNISTNKIMQIAKKKLSKIFIDQWKESLNSDTNKQGNMGNKLHCTSN